MLFGVIIPLQKKIYYKKLRVEIEKLEEAAF